MTSPLDVLSGGVQGLIDPPLEFTRNRAREWEAQVIAAFSKPLPAQDPISSYRYLRARGDVLKDAFRQRPLVRMQDKNLQQLAVIGNEISCVAEEVAADTGEATVVIRGGDYLGDFVRNAVRIEEDLHLSIDPNPTKPSWKTRWGGKIHTINVKRDSSGIHTVELIAASQREHLKHVLVGTTPFFPPEVQPLKMWLMLANCRTACAATFFINLARQFEPGLSFLTNIFNPAGWINPLSPDAILNVNPLQWGIQTQFVNPVLDQSRTTVFTGAWNDFHTASQGVMKDAGVCARAYTYFTEDEDNPHPELEALLPNTPLSSIPIVGTIVDAVDAFLERTGLGDIPDDATIADLARPQRNCVMVAFEDHSGYSGPTGTAVDGVINLWSSTLDDLITTTVFPVDADDDGEVDPVFRKLFLVAPEPPWAVYRDGQHSGIIESGYHQHKGPVKTVMTGGHSPKLVNDIQTFFIRYGISQIAQAVAMFGELPAVEGLDNLYQGQLDNILLAWQRYTDPLRALYTGDLGYLESFERPGSSAYTISAILNLRQANWKTRAYRSFKTSIRQSAPYVIGHDILLDDRVGFEQDGILYVDQVSAIKYEWDRHKPVTFSVSVGDDTRDEDPFSQGIRAMQALYVLASAAVGEGTLFE